MRRLAAAMTPAERIERMARIEQSSSPCWAVHPRPSPVSGGGTCETCGAATLRREWSARRTLHVDAVRRMSFQRTTSGLLLCWPWHSSRRSHPRRRRPLQPRHPADPVRQLLRLPRPRREGRARPTCGSTRRTGCSRKLENGAPVVPGDAGEERGAAADHRRRRGRRDAAAEDAARSSRRSRRSCCRRWIEQGAEWEGHWSFVAGRRGRRCRRSKDAAWVRNPIDAFILARLEAEGLKPSPRGGQGRR